MNEFLEQFLIESRELIAQATEDLLALEHAPGDANCFEGAFRAFHTLKGAAGIMDFEAMAQICHAAEDVLSGVRGGQREMSPLTINDCLACLDQITDWLATMEASEALPDPAGEDAVRLIARLTLDYDKPATTMPSAALSATASRLAASPALAADILHEQVEILALQADEGAGGRAAAASHVIQNVLRKTNLIEALGEQAAIIGADSSTIDADASNETTTAAARPTRTDTARIDALMRLSGELVIVKNALGHSVALAIEAGLPKQQSQNLVKAYSQLDRLTTELLDASVAARVLPLRQVFQRFPRQVREMAAGIGKKIRLVTEGGATEADRLIAEALVEPLLHVLRNAVDHGVEPVEQREAAGKPIPSIIRLSATRVGEQIVIEISDDGRGIDPAVIRATAQVHNFVNVQTLATMSDEALLQLIFAPGFSTAGSVSNLSGRGVGMDAVRAVIEGLGGRISVESRLGSGTVIRFHLPFAALLTKVLNVDAGGQLFGIPFEAVAETLKIRREDVVRLGAAETVLWRGRTLPLISLARTLHLAEIAVGQVVQIVILEDEDGFIALTVDGLGKQSEIMLKPLDGLLARMRGVAGTALLGDGRILIVLELQELLK